jgi:predicted transcriptional regulator YheO
MYKKNKSWENVAKVLGVSRNGMFKHIRKLKLYFPIIRHYKIEYLNRLHRKYRTWRKVAAYLEVSLVGLYQHIRKNKSAVIQA